nr:zinc finger, CCHC-type, retrotransposon Gag domain protein [Tanacetum cinerariifolium]
MGRFQEVVFLQFFPRAEQVRLKREYHSSQQTSTETSTEFMQRFLRLAGFLGAAAGTEEEQAKNFQWGLRRSTLNHLMCMSYTDVAQVANAARNYEILYERDDEDTERPDKRHAVFVLFDTGATHFVISSAFATRITTTPTSLDHPMGNHGIAKWVLLGGDNRLRMGCLVAAGIGQGVG